MLSGDGRRGRPSGSAQPSRPGDGSDVGAVLAAFLQQHRLTQAQLADRLGVDCTYVSKVLSGRRQIRDVGRLRQVAHAIGVPPERFGLFPDPRETADATSSSHIVAREVREDVEAWRDVRKILNHRRPELTRVASSLYVGTGRIADTPLITSSKWMPAEPVDLGALRLGWADERTLPCLTGQETETEPCRPLMPHDGRYPRYCQAIRDLGPPSLCENRASYRLLDLGCDGCHQTYGYTTYFDMVDVCEAVAHEVAAAWLRCDGNAAQIKRYVHYRPSADRDLSRYISADISRPVASSAEYRA
jgi:transcriptional regulator with XRE-family HTH domain